MEFSIAIDDYEHVRAFADGKVQVSGASFSFHQMPMPSETFHRQVSFSEWDVSELSLAVYCGMRASGDERFIALPVFPSRKFRHSCVVVVADSPLTSLDQLSGRRVGVPEWGQTAGVWVRGILGDEYKVGLDDVEWFQGGVAEVGRPEHLTLRLPAGVSVKPITDEPLAAKLLNGELDAVIAAWFPPALLASGRCRTLIADPRTAEIEYYDKTGIFPIMHVVAIRTDVHLSHRWLAKELVKAFGEAKRQSLERLCALYSTHYPLAHLPEFAVEITDRFGGDPWPYGLEANRHTLSTFLRYELTQGLMSSPLEPEQLFAPSSIDVYRG